MQFRRMLLAAALLATTTSMAAPGRVPPRAAGLDQVTERVRQGLRPAGDPVTVILEFRDPAARASGAISRHGGRLRFRSGQLQELEVPAGKLEAFLAELPDGVYARPPFPHDELSTIGQGVALTGAADIQALGNGGAGVTVGIIDLGFGQLYSSLSTGDLPANVGQTDYTGTGIGGTTDHGTNVAEIVHDMAPAAALQLARIDTETQLFQAITDMTAQGVRVIVHSVGWYGSSFYDGTGPLCNAINSAASAGVVWVNAVGNERLNHSLATFTDTNGDRLHEFAPGQNYNTIDVGAGARIRLVLNWDAYPTTRIDYDLLLYSGPPNAGGTLVASSTTKPGSGTFGGVTPYEQIDYVAPTTRTYYVVVRKATTGTANVRLSLFSLGYALGVQTPASSLSQPADCASSLSVGATDLSDNPETYSSEGPTTDGRPKPEVVAPARVRTSLTESFGGSSAAAPHAAGAAALLLAANPSLLPSQVRDQLQATALDISPAGFDYWTGAGRISLDADGDGVNHDADNCPLTYNPLQVDSDGDGHGDECDNCSLVSNPDQRDTNGDGYGNICDADFNNNGIVDSQDGALLKSAFGSSLYPDRDLNGNGVVDSQDGALLKSRFGQPPGPSGLHPP